ncbi:MAG: hypothetical protein QNJ70_04765 [Xenococcaceae cyanobacterium MO_207.B15]|nr:hypothetical protein [Xenococcaceae cyanobacterium MO_207.B15]
MKAIKVMGTIDEQGQLALDSPLTVEKPSRVEVIVLIPEDTEIEENQTKEEILNDFRQAWQEAMNGETIPVDQLWED